MERIKNYRRIVKEVLEEYAQNKSAFPEIETQLIFDTTRDHYQVVKVGWHELDRTYGCSVHIDIKNQKIWIQHNATEIDFAQKLVEKGVPKENIVLGLHPAYKRQYTGFAVA